MGRLIKNALSRRTGKDGSFKLLRSDDGSGGGGGAGVGGAWHDTADNAGDPGIVSVVPPQLQYVRAIRIIYTRPSDAADEDSVIQFTAVWNGGIERWSDAISLPRHAVRRDFAFNIEPDDALYPLLLNEVKAERYAGQSDSTPLYAIDVTVTYDGTPQRAPTPTPSTPVTPITPTTPVNPPSSRNPPALGTPVLNPWKSPPPTVTPPVSTLPIAKPPVSGPDPGIRPVPGTPPIAPPPSSNHPLRAWLVSTFPSLGQYPIFRP